MSTGFCRGRKMRDDAARIQLPQALAASMAGSWIEDGRQFVAKEGVLEHFAFLSAGKSSPSCAGTGVASAKEQEGEAALITAAHRQVTEQDISFVLALNGHAIGHRSISGHRCNRHGRRIDNNSRP